MIAAPLPSRGPCGSAVELVGSSPVISGPRALVLGRRPSAARVRRARSGKAQAESEEGRVGGGDDDASEKSKTEKTSPVTGVTDALDFARARSERDVELLANASDATRSGEQMNREQYGALRRKIGGTYRDFFKDSVDVIGDYVDDGWVDKRCRVCKKDTSEEPRTKDSFGRYAHVACLENEKSGNFFTRWFGGK